MCDGHQANGDKECDNRSNNGKLAGNDHPETKNASNDDKTKRVLLIGETGSGKSTFINYVTNFFCGGTFMNVKVAIPTCYHCSTENLASDELSVKDPSSSQEAGSCTDSCTSYHLDDFVFIDTPGLSDTRGQSQDEANMQKISEAATKAGDITALVFVMNGSNARMTLGMQNVISHLRGHVPDRALTNVIVILTNTTQNQSNFDTDEFKKHFAKTTVFYMNNCAFSCDPKTRIAAHRLTMDINWKLSMKTAAILTRRLMCMVDLNTKLVDAQQADDSSEREPGEVEIVKVDLTDEDIAGLSEQPSYSAVRERFDCDLKSGRDIHADRPSGSNDSDSDETSTTKTDDVGYGKKSQEGLWRCTLTRY
jgi:ribosome biogenesis GTPase A